MKTLYSQQTVLSSQYINSKIQEFLNEDYAHKDITTKFSLLKKSTIVIADIIAEQNLIFTGTPIIMSMFQDCQISIIIQEGNQCNTGDKLVRIIGDATLLLSRERVLLNLIQRLSGIASLTHHYVNTLNTKSIKILDTRKTTPGLRLFEKYAVTIGGGYNHRVDLYDGVMFKDNHFTVLNDLKKSITQLKIKYPNKKIQIEVDTFNQLALIINQIDLQIDAILLDNMIPNETIKCVQLIRSKLPNCFIESSGGITLENINNYKHIDIDGISIGALTHQAVSKSIKFEFIKHEK